MKLVLKFGDVTKMMPEYVSAHCISEDCVMGSGVVIAYRNLLPGLKAACMEYVRNAKAASEKVWHTTSGLIVPFRYVDQDMVLYNMYTKKFVKDHAGKGMTYEKYLANIRESLEYVRNSMLQHSEEKLCISKIGCGRDRCNWEDIKAILIDVFNETDIEILVCEFDEATIRN